MSLSRRMLIAALGSAPILSLVTQRALAAYPDRPIHLIVPFAAGGNADIVGRITGDLISKALGQPVVVENRGGGGGSIGAGFVVHATPDGYTLLVGSNGPLTVDPLLHANLGYDPLKDFTAVALTSYVPHALILSNKIQAKTMTELVAQSKNAAVTIATSGIGSATHMTLERLKAATGANLTHVPLSRRRRADARFDQWECGWRHDRILDRAADAPGRPSPYHRHRGTASFEARAGHSDFGRERRERLHRAKLYWRGGAGEDACRCRRQVTTSNRPRFELRKPRRGAVDQPRLGSRFARADDCEGIRGVHSRRLREYARGRQVRRDHAAIAASIRAFSFAAQ